MTKIPGLDALRRKHAGIDTAPLFDEPKQRTTQPKRRPPRPVDRITCPLCRQHKIGLYVKAWRPETGRVLAIKRHYRRTLGGAEILCRRSDTEYILDTPRR